MNRHWENTLIPNYSPPDLLRRPQPPRLQRFVRSRILTVQASTFPVRSVTKTLHAQGLEPPRDDLVMNNPGLSRFTRQPAAWEFTLQQPSLVVYLTSMTLSGRR